MVIGQARMMLNGEGLGSIFAPDWVEGKFASSDGCHTGMPGMGDQSSD